MNYLQLNTPITYQNCSSDDVDPEFKKYAQMTAFYISRTDYTLVIGKNKTNPNYFLALRRRITFEDTPKYVVATLALSDFIQATEELARHTAAHLLDVISTTMHKAEEKHKNNWWLLMIPLSLS